MEISNRSVTLLCATAIVVAVILRVGHSNTAPTTVVDSTGPAAVSSQSTTVRAQEPQDSDFRMIDQSPQTNDGQPAEVSPVTNSTKPAVAPAQTTATTDEDDPEDDGYIEEPPAAEINAPQPSRRENSAAWAYDAPNDREGNLTDRELFDRLMGFMNEDQQADFRIVWTAMSPEDREQFLNQMRGNPNQR